MRILFDLGHPAHFHLFRNTIGVLLGGGHDVELIAHQKDCLPGLLDEAGWGYHLVRRRGRGLAAMGAEATETMGVVISKSLTKPFDLMVGTSIVIGPASRLTGATSVVFSEDDAAVVPLFAKLAYFTAHYIATPRSLAHEAYGPKHLTYPGYHELAYLHPRLYRPDPNVRELLGVRPGEKYFLLRLVAMKAHHDVGQRGLNVSRIRAVVRRLLPHGRVFISAEGDIPADLRKYLLPTPVDRIFDVVASAEMVVGDGQTMAIEAAMLGTPSLRCNTFVGRLSVLEELQDRYGLTVGVRPENFGQLIGRIDDWLARRDLKAEWRKKSRAMLSDCIDLSRWILDLLNHLARRRAVLRSYRRFGSPVLAGNGGAGQEAGRSKTVELERPFQEKYSSHNPASRLLVRRFFRSMDKLLFQSDACAGESRILDVGAGEGDAYLFLSPMITRRGVVALEPDPGHFVRMARIAPELAPAEGSIYQIPFDDDSFETVVCLEVLEHLEDPAKGLRELLRVAGVRVILSVPREPTWRILNMLRGAYWGSLGNTPGHINHWSRGGFVRWVGRYADIKAVRSSLPWTIVSAAPKR